MAGWDGHLQPHGSARPANATPSRSVIEAAKRPLSPRRSAGRGRAQPCARWAWPRSIAISSCWSPKASCRSSRCPGESPRYEMRESAHHHHFQCTTCRRVYDVPGCPGNLRRLAPRGFTVEHHDVTLYGRCSDCGKRELRAAPMIRLEQLRFGYNGGDDVLRLDEFVLEPESNVLVVGPSGCGKTTLLHLIAGLLLPTERLGRRRRTGSVGALAARARPLPRAPYRHRAAAVPSAADADRDAEPAGRAKHRRACRWIARLPTSC